ncbi:MAG: tetratricopeptide repeat protein [Treponema sp.]|nr:tetratricopeptide repeat protein [Treponema sp.]
MAKDALSIASKMMRRRQFSLAIKLLDGRSDVYEGNFNYYFLLGQACLYAGDAGTASSYFQKAREIKITDVNLLLAQAALFLRRGQTDRAIQYYLEALENDPQNQIAKDALDFIRTKGDYTTICQWVDSGKIEKFYPPLPKSSFKNFGVIVLPLLALVLGFFVMYAFISNRSYARGNRADLSSIELTQDERRFAKVDENTSAPYQMSSREISESYENAQRYFQSYRDNAAQKEINRILYSNALPSIKQKARLLMEYLSEPTFDTITDNPEYEDVVKNPMLYIDCYVVWSGRVSNAVMQGENFRCDFLVGYETMEKVKGIVPLYFQSNPGIQNTKGVKVLGRIRLQNDRFFLDGIAVYQSVNDLLQSP